MATVTVTEYSSGAGSMCNDANVAQAPALQTQNITIGGASATATVKFTESTRLIRVHTDAICRVEPGGKSPVAVATSARMAANQTEYWGVNPGDNIAVITSA